MSLREKYIQAVRREISNYVPFYFEFTPPQEDKFKSKFGDLSFQEYFKFPVEIVRLSYCGESLVERYKKYLDKWIDNPNLRIGDFGNVSVKSNTTHFAHFEAIMMDFEEISEFQQYPYPNAVEDYDWKTFKQKVERIHQRGVAVEGELDITIFEIAWYMRGMEQTLVDMYINPEILEYHLDRITEIRCEQARKIASIGVDTLKLGDDIATQQDMMMDPVMWRKFYKGRLEKIIKAAKEVKPDIIIKYHTDGNPEKVISELIEIGVELLNPIQPECILPEKVKELYGDRLSMDGTMGTQTLFPFGTAKDVKEQTLDRIKKCAYNGGLVIAPSHVIEPEVPWENIIAFVDTLNEYNNKLEK